MSTPFPPLVTKLCHAHNAWIVGSAANPLNKSPRDYDILVPFSSWDAAAQLIPPDAVPNTFGGWKCKSKDVEIDVWPGELGRLMIHPAANFAWHPASGVRLRKE